MSRIEQDSDSQDQISGGLGVTGLLRELTPFFRGDCVSTVQIVFLVIIHAVIGRAIVSVLGQAIDRGMIEKDTSILLKMATLYFALEISQMSLQVGISTWFARVGNRVLFRLRDHLVSHVQKLPISYFDRVASGRIVTRLTSDTVSLTELFQQGLLSVFSSCVALVTITTAMLFISWKMTLVTLLVGPPMVWIAFRLSDKILVANREAKKHVSAINAFVAESVSGVRVLQLFNRVSTQRERFESLSGVYRDANLKTVALYALFHPTVSLFTGVTVATALYVGGWITAEGTITTGAMISFIFHVKDFADPLRNILEKYQLFQNSVSSGERVFALLKEQHEEDGNSLPSESKDRFGTVRFERVSFTYHAELPLALEEVSFEIPRGKTLAVIGRTGSGKSTLIALLQRFRDPIAGQILIDGRPLAEISRSEVRRRIGVVQQEVFMFRGTIEDNIGLGDPTISVERIAQAAQEAGLERLLRMRPGGLKATVEEKGANLSVGERQLVAFARILAFDPQILVLDEATSNVDSETEQLLQLAAIQARRNRTSIIIAHRLSTVEDSDFCLVLAQGKIENFGPTQEILSALKVPPQPQPGE
jgi:ATP-binding cassette subfamily B multidrug efflux pump